MKALEYRIWARSILKQDKNFTTLSKTQNLMRSIRSIRLDKNFQNKNYKLLSSLKIYSFYYLRKGNK